MNMYKKILEYWNNKETKSMYDKILLNLEISAIKGKIIPGSKILDVGCGEGEGTLAYSHIPGVTIHAADFSDTRLQLAKRRFAKNSNTVFKKIDFLKHHTLDNDYDTIVSQRFLINIPEWPDQKKVIGGLLRRLKKNGIIIFLEGSKVGVDELNGFRSFLKLPGIPVKWHNQFLNDNIFVDFLEKNGYKLIEKKGFGFYFLMTRGIKPFFVKSPKWNSAFNRLAAFPPVNLEKYSRLKLWIFTKGEIPSSSHNPSPSSLCSSGPSAHNLFYLLYS